MLPTRNQTPSTLRGILLMVFMIFYSLNEKNRKLSKPTCSNGVPDDPAGCISMRPQRIGSVTRPA